MREESAGKPSSFASRDPSFAERVTERVQHAKQVGALHVTRTQAHVVEDQGVPFLVHQALEKRHKPHGKRFDPRTQSDPFERHDPHLFVEDISTTHKVLLNKYPVLDNHLLLVTKKFEHQQSWLTVADFEAIARTVERMDALIFYNGGPVAGASQPHKHIQALPLPLGHQDSPVPLWPGDTRERDDSSWTGTVSSWPFLHLAVRMPGEAHEVGPQELLRQATEAMNSLELLDRHSGLPAPFNLVIVRNWMWIVPRVEERVGKISINGLGFVGSFYVKNQRRLSRLRATGPMKALELVTGSRAFEE